MEDVEKLLIPYFVFPVFEINTLEDALKFEYGEDFIAEIQSEFGSLRQLLFNDNYINGVCLKYPFRTLDKEETSQAHFENRIKTFLMDIVPEAYPEVLIDVSW